MRWIVYLFFFISPSYLFAATQAPNPQLVEGRIQWSPVEAISINVHSGDGAWIVSLPGDTTVWTPDQIGAYFFVATDTSDWSGWGRSSTVSVERLSVPENSGVPSPEMLRAEVYSSSAVELFWQVPSNGDVSSFIVKRNGEELKTITGRSFYQDGLAEGTTYSYAVSAVDATGAVSAESFVSVTTGGEQSAGQQTPETETPETEAPSTNGVTFATYSPTAAELFWQRPTGFLPPTSFEIYRNDVYVTSTSGYSYFDSELTPGTSYQFDVRYVSGSVRGMGRFIGTVNFVTPGGNVVEPEVIPIVVANRLPTAVIDLTASVYSDEALELFWGLASDPDGTVVGYDVYRDDQPVAQVEGGSFFDIGLNPSTTYSYQVRARDNTGAIGPAVTIEAVTKDSPIALPEPVAIELPEDCIFARDSDGSVFCYSPTDRSLLSTYPDGSLYWSFALPGESGVNDIRELVLTEDALVIVAELNAAEGTSGYELSAFDKTGEYRYTVPILSGLESAKIVSDAARPLRVLVDNGDLIIVGEYALQGGNGDAIGTFAARTNTDTGATDALRRFSGRVLGGAPTIAEGALLLTLDGAFALFDVLTLEPLNTSSGLTFNTNNYQESKELALSLMKSADFAAIDGRIENAIGAVVPDDFVVPISPGDADKRYEVNCTEGGSIRILFSYTGAYYGNSKNIKNYEFVSCVIGVEVIDGEYELTRDVTLGKYNSSSATVISYKNMHITQPGKALWRVDGNRTGSSYNSQYGTLSNSSGSADAVMLSDYYEDRLGETISIKSSYSSGARSSSNYNQSTGGQDYSSSNFNEIVGTASRGSKANDSQLDIIIEPELVYETGALSLSAGKLEISSSDGSSLVVESNNGDKDSVQYRISDGVQTTVLDDVW